MRKWRLHILLFIGVYLLTMVATLPAALALRWAEPLLARLPQRPLLQGVSGSVWSGHALQVTYRGTALGEVGWELSPWSLLIGRINVALKLVNEATHLDADLSTGFNAERVQLRDVSGQLPAAWVKNLVPSLPVAPAGSFAVNLAETSFEAARLRTLDGRIVWNKGGVTAPIALEFGDLVAEFSSGEKGIAARIKDSGGPMQLEADLQLGPDGSYTITGKSSARASAAPALKTSLSLLGQPDVQGRIPFRFNGRL